MLGAAVVAMAIPTGGEAPKAYVVTPQQVSADELMAYVAGRVAPYKKVRAVEFIEQIPKTSAGKILRCAMGLGRSAGAGSSGSLYVR